MREGLCCAHLMGKVTLQTGLLVASGLAEGLRWALSQYAARCLVSLTRFGQRDGAVEQIWVKGSRVAEQTVSGERC